MAQCPAHDDSNPSMQIKDKGDGTASIECYAGCDFVDILKAVGFYTTGGSKTPETAPSAPPRGHAKRQPRNRPSRSRYPTGRNITAYRYTDASEKGMQFVVIRRDFAGEKPKSFSQWMPAEEGWAVDASGATERAAAHLRASAGCYPTHVNGQRWDCGRRAMRSRPAGCVAQQTSNHMGGRNKCVASYGLDTACWPCRVSYGRWRRTGTQGYASIGTAPYGPWMQGYNRASAYRMGQRRCRLAGGRQGTRGKDHRRPAGGLRTARRRIRQIRG